jgi:ornithine cyclodeaminase/alanine dehydrogenase-like protein (mu-crystallin family)
VKFWSVAKPAKQRQGDHALQICRRSAIQDVATAQLVYRKALEQNVGTNVEI